MREHDHKKPLDDLDGRGVLDRVEYLGDEIANLERAIAIYCQETISIYFETDAEAVAWFLAKYPEYSTEEVRDE